MVCVFLACGWVRAEPLPPDVEVLASKVSAAQRQLGDVRVHMQAVQRRYAVMDTRLRRATSTLLRAQQYPPGFWWARSIVAGEPMAADLASMAVRQGVADIAAVDQRVKSLRALYGEANEQIAALRALEEAYRAARGRLSDDQRDALRAAMVQADLLAQRLTEVKPVSGEVVVPIPEPALVTATVLPSSSEQRPDAPRFPIAGQVVQRFRGGKGATAEGVVMKGAAGAEVRSLVAGEVLYSGPFRQFGGLVIVKSVGGEDVLYGGLGSLRTTTGAHVLAGDVLGGLADDGKLYWEVRRRGKTINPLAITRTR